MISPVREPVSDVVVTIRWSRYDVHSFTCRTCSVWQLASVVRLCRYVRSSIRKRLPIIFSRGLSGNVKPIPFAVVVEFCYRQRCEHLRYRTVSGVPKNFFRGGGSTNSVEHRGQRERGSGGGSPLVRGSGGSCNLVQEISFHMVTFWYFSLFMTTTSLFVIANVKQLRT